MKQEKIKSWDKRNDVLTLICEWDDCLNIYDDLALFFSHITDHVCIKDMTYNQTENDENNANTFKCLWRNCTIEENGFSSLLYLLNHLNFHAYHQKLKSIGATLVHKNNLNKCSLDAINRNALPDPIDVMCCEWKKCRESILNPENFFNHVNEHIDEYAGGNSLNDGCQCHWKYCTIKVKNKYRLRDHIRTHTHEKICACPTCGTFFSNATKFVDHIKRQAVSPTLSYQCLHCDKKFSTRRILKSHMGQHIYKYRCPFCNISCISPSSLRLHIRYKHMEDRPHQCPECEYRSKTHIDLRKHLEIHKDNFLFCEFKGCLYKTRFLWRLNLHIKNTHQNSDKCKYVCDECGLKYRNGSKLSQHLKKKHDLTLPEGHSRFLYKLDRDGFYHLQTIRYEKMRMTEQEIEKSHIGASSSPDENSLESDWTPVRDDLHSRTLLLNQSNSSESPTDVRKRVSCRSKVVNKTKMKNETFVDSANDSQELLGNNVDDVKDSCMLLSDFNIPLSVIGCINVVNDLTNSVITKSKCTNDPCLEQEQEEYNLMQL